MQQATYGPSLYIITYIEITLNLHNLAYLYVEVEDLVIRCIAIR